MVLSFFAVEPKCLGRLNRPIVRQAFQDEPRQDRGNTQAENRANNELHDDELYCAFACSLSGERRARPSFICRTLAYQADLIRRCLRSTSTTRPRRFSLEGPDRSRRLNEEAPRELPGPGARTGTVRFP